MPLEILAVLISAFFGILGYFIREYKNRVTPFFQILYIEEVRATADSITLPDSIINNIENCVYITSLNKETQLNEVLKCFGETDDFKNCWRDIKEGIHQVIQAESDDEFIKNLALLFQSTYFDNWIVYYLVNKKLDCPPISDSLPLIIPIYDDFDDTETGGSVLVDFPKNQTIGFGKNFKYEFYRDKCRNFLDSVKYCQKESIKELLKKFSIIAEKEYNLSNEIYHPLENIIKKYSRWGFYTYIANINTCPIIIDNNAKILIRDSRGKFQEDCRLASVSEDDSGSLSLDNYTRRSIVLQPGTDKLIGFVTNKAQKDMEFGDAIREVFERRQAICQIEIQIRKIGLFRKQKYKCSISDFCGQIE